MKEPIYYIDRITGELKEEKVYGEKALLFLYHNNPLSRFFVNCLSKNPLFSKIYGFWQRLPWTKHKIAPFIKRYQIDVQESLIQPDQFRSFDHFFTRHLKPEARPIHPDPTCAVIPADGRFLFYQDVSKSEEFIVKGKKFSLPKLIGDPHLARLYEQGSMLIARLCPTDYHRFHFPCDGIPKKARLINGWLFAVSPIAIKQNCNILAENKRMLTEIETKEFGTVLYIEIGATCVGSIHQTYTPNILHKKGDEKGFFSFGGSSLIVLFEQDRVAFDTDLLANTTKHIETFCRFGQAMGKKPHV